MKKILLSLGMIVFVGAAILGATGAFFSDTETSTGNTFTAGELDLQVDNSSYGYDWNDPTNEEPTGVWGPNAANSWSLRDLDTCGPNSDQSCLFFNFTDLKPGDFGEDTISLHVQNNAWACMALDLTSTPDNGINGPEDEAGDVTDGVDGGELQNYLSFIFWNDDGDNVLEEGEDVIDELSGLPGSIFTGEMLAIAESGDEPLQAGETTFIGKGWCFGTMEATPEAPLPNPEGPTPGNTGFTCDGSGNHNLAQTDGFVVDVSFYSEQARNNDDFLCDPQTAPETATVTVDKEVTFSSTTVIGVDVNDFTLTIDGPIPGTGDAQVVVDQVATVGLPLGIYTVSEVYSNDPPGALFNATFGGSCTEIGDTGEATMTLVAGVNPTCTITNVVAPLPQQP